MRTCLVRSSFLIFFHNYLKTNRYCKEPCAHQGATAGDLDLKRGTDVSELSPLKKKKKEKKKSAGEE